MPVTPLSWTVPACSPAAIRAVLAANAGADVLRSYDRELDAAFEQAREDRDLTPLVQTVRRWWFEADVWRDPEARALPSQRRCRCMPAGFLILEPDRNGREA